MRVLSVVRTVLCTFVLLLVARDARAQNAEGGTGTAGWALASMFLLAAPLDFYGDYFGYANDLTFSQALLSVVQRQAATFPIGSSSGGFTYAFDPQLGLPVRRTRSFGPMFAERPLTNGSHRFTVNVAAQQTSWRALGGVDFRKGLTAIRTYKASDTVTGDAEAEYAKTRITFRTARSVLGVNYGLTSRIDVGVLLAYGESVVTGQLNYTRTDLTTGRVLVVDDREYSGVSAGVGDATFRAKFEFLSHPSVDFAAGVDVRLPTGSGFEVLGAGATQTKLTLIGAFPRGQFAPHFNVGYTLVPGYTAGVRANSAQAANITNADEIDYTLGADVAVSSSVTVAGDVIGRSLLRSYNFERTVDPLVSEISMRPGTVNLLLGAAGAKVLVGREWLLNFSLAFAINNAGLKPGLTPVIGIERPF